jgi:hypothetical protein
LFVIDFSTCLLAIGKFAMCDEVCNDRLFCWLQDAGIVTKFVAFGSESQNFRLTRTCQCLQEFSRIPHLSPPKTTNQIWDEICTTLPFRIDNQAIANYYITHKAHQTKHQIHEKFIGKTSDYFCQLTQYYCNILIKDVI